MSAGPIGIFDSGYGGLTVLKEIVAQMPGYDYIYLGDNARAPYGTRSYEVVYQFTLQAVKKLFDMGCHLVILACNTASAKALRTIQQHDLPIIDPSRRVLGVIRPSVEVIQQHTHTNKIGILGTPGTVNSNSYTLEINKLFPNIEVFQEACPMWVPLIENNEHLSEGADYFVKKNLSGLIGKNKDIDAIILGCTHYPLLYDKIVKFLPHRISVISQGEIVAVSLTDYLMRHPEMDAKCSKNNSLKFYTTDSVELFNKNATIFFDATVNAEHLTL